MIRFENTYADLPPQLFTHQAPVPVKAPELMALNEPLARELGLDIDWLRGPLGVAMLAGNLVIEGSTPIAQAYAGHQFGGWSPSLGDGRAVLLGELNGPAGRVDLALKGSGQTAYSRRGDGRAWVGPVLREFIVSEAMAALNIPTTRALAAVSTGEIVARGRAYPGAVLARIAGSHIRVGTFQYLAARNDDAGLRALTDYAIARHYPQADGPLGLLQSVVAAQARLIADWMAVGFIHGVMNTDNMAISGETIDYGPCAFIDGYHPQKVFSSIDQMGRYAFANQPSIGAWNLAQLATSLLPIMDGNEATKIEAATAAVGEFAEICQARWLENYGRKIGIAQAGKEDLPLIEGLLARMGSGRADFTRVFAGLSEGPDFKNAAAQTEFNEAQAWASWAPDWAARLTREADPKSVMRATNPRRIARNHRVEEAIEAAVDGNIAPFHRLIAAIRAPFKPHDDWADLAVAPTPNQEVRQTFCGT